MPKGILYLVPTPIGNLGDMTYRGVEILKSVDLIAAEDTRTSKVLLNHYGIRNKLISYHKFNESKQTKSLLDLLDNGKNIAIITDAGTPAISDPASILVKAAINKDVQVVCLPGATAVIPALAASGLNTESFTFIGFLPVKKKDRKQILENLKTYSHTIVLFESTHKITETLLELQTFLGNRNCVVAKELSKIYETYYRGTFSEIVNLTEFDSRGEFVILIEGKKQTEIDDNELLALIRKKLVKGIPLKEISTELSEVTGINRNRIYKLALSEKEKS